MSEKPVLTIEIEDTEAVRALLSYLQYTGIYVGYLGLHRKEVE